MYREHRYFGYSTVFIALSQQYRLCTAIVRPQPTSSVVSVEIDIDNRLQLSEAIVVKKTVSLCVALLVNIVFERFESHPDVCVPLWGNCIRSDGVDGSPTLFHVQIGTDIRLLEMIGNIKTPHNVHSNLEVGAIGVAICEDEWCRVEILNMNKVSIDKTLLSMNSCLQDGVVLCFVDFGNIAEYKASQVYTFDEEDEALMNLH